MRFWTWNDWIVALSLIHLGQQLGSDTPATRAIFHLVEILKLFFGR